MGACLWNEREVLAVVVFVALAAGNDACMMNTVQLIVWKGYFFLVLLRIEYIFRIKYNMCT